MFLEWTPSRLGRLLTRSANWRLLVESDRLVVAVGGEQYHIAPETLPSFEIKSRTLWSALVWPASTGVRFGGLSNLRAPALHRALNDLLKRSRCQRFDSYYAKLSRWLAEADHALATADQKHRWLRLPEAHRMCPLGHAKNVSRLDPEFQLRSCGANEAEAHKRSATEI